MFTLWYTVLSWREYKDIIWEKLSTTPKAAPKEPPPSISCPIPTKKPEPIPTIAPQQKPAPSQDVKKPAPAPPPPPAAPVPVPAQQKPLQPPPKPPRSPSPHPNRNEVFEPDVEFEEDSEEEEEDDEENSVIDSQSHSVNDFIKQEIVNHKKVAIRIRGSFVDAGIFVYKF